MRYVLENEVLRVEIDSFGAEIKSVKRKSDGLEYMWQANPEYWGRTSPVLFPFVGVPRDKKYRYAGNTYPMGQHGFARDMEFSCESIDGSRANVKDRCGEYSVWFSLESDETTYEKYPFHFRLYIGYELRINKVKVFWRVENIDEKPIYFSIGAHPAFHCPIHGESDKVGYGLRFGGCKDMIYHHGNTPEGLAVMETFALPLEDGRVRFTPEFFDKCTYMIEGEQSHSVELFDAEGKTYVTVDFDAPLFAIWSPEGKNAPFVCIEPWYGRCDAVDFDGSIAERAYENALSSGGEFEAKYSIKFAI